MLEPARSTTSIFCVYNICGRERHRADHALGTGVFHPARSPPASGQEASTMEGGKRWKIGSLVSFLFLLLPASFCVRLCSFLTRGRANGAEGVLDNQVSSKMICLRDALVLICVSCFVSVHLLRFGRVSFICSSLLANRPHISMNLNIRFNKGITQCIFE